MKNRSVLLSLVVAILTGPQMTAATLKASQESLGVQVWLDDMPAVTYRARIDGDWLVVQAEHEPGWHTYAMDNVVRARKKSGKAQPETELPTVITPLDGQSVRGPWRQSAPVDLSTPEIRWFTWGFEAKSYFAVRIDNAADPSSVQIDAQACTEALCAMVEALVVPIDAQDSAPSWSVDPESLVVVSE